MTATRPATHAARRRGGGSLEREAERAAARVRSGAIGVAASFSRTQAGRRIHGIGSGVPLPVAWRDKPERAFGADFAAVRLHADALPQSAPRAATTGADILLRGRAFPAGADGDALLHHELAHVLQQTGRRGSDGRIHATAVHGTGAIQGEGGDLEPFFPGASDLLASLVAVHANGRSEAALAVEDADLAEVIAVLQAKFPDGMAERDPGPFGEELERIVCQNKSLPGASKKVSAYTFGAQGFLADCLKVMGLFTGAAVLLKRGPFLPSAGVYPGMYEYVKTGGGKLDAAASSLLLSFSVMKGFWIDGQVAELRRYLYDPERAVTPIAGLELYVTDIEHKALDWYELSEASEVVFYAVALIAQFENLRTGLLSDIATKVAALYPEYSPVQRRFTLALNLLVETRESATAATLPAAKELWSALAAETDQAIRFWNRAEEGRVAVFAGGAGVATTLDEQTLREVRATLTGDTLAGAIEETLYQHGEILLSAPAGKPLARDAYDLARDAFLMATEAYRGELAEALLVAADAAAPSDNQSLAYALLVIALEQLEKVLRAYDSKRDKDETDVYAAYGGAYESDHRLFHRVAIAREMQRWAPVLGSTRLTEAAERVTSGQDVDCSSLILEGGWEKESVAVDQLTRDFTPDHHPFELTPGGDAAELRYLPITTGHIATFYSTLFAEALADAIEVAAADPSAPDLARHVPVMQRALVAANEAMRGMDRPQRWRMKVYEFIEHPDGPLFGDLLKKHPKTRKLITDQIDPELGAYVLPQERGDGVFAWTIPTLAPLIAALRDIAPLNALVAQIAQVDPATLGDWDWIVALSVTAGDPASAADVIRERVELALVSGLIEAGQEARWRRAEQAVTERLPAVAQQERAELGKLIKEALLAYAGGDITAYEKPNEALAAIQRFHLTVLSPEQRDAELAALLLTLVPEMQKAFTPTLLFGWGQKVEARFDLISGYTPLLRMALKQLEADPAKVEALLTVEERAAHSVATRTAELAAILTAFEQAAREAAAQFRLTSADGKTLATPQRGIAIEPNAAFMASGAVYELVEVYQPFSYVPAYGEGGQAVHAFQVLDAAGNAITDPNTPLFRARLADDEPEDVLAGDERLLEQMRAAVAERANQLFLENTLQALQDLPVVVGELTLEAAELIPGAGQVVLGTRIAYAIIKFIASGEYQEVLAILRGDPVVLIHGLVETVEKGLPTIDDLWIFLLFGGPLLDDLKAHKLNERHTKLRSMSKSSRIAHVLAALAQIPIRVADAIEDARRAIRGPVHAIQLWIAARPRVADAIRVAEMVAVNLDHPIDELVRTSLLGEAEGFVDRLYGLLESIATLELPEEVIPNELVVEAIFDLIIERLPLKAELAVRGIDKIASLLGEAGLVDYVSEQIAESIRGTAADPNKVWREAFLPRVTDTFNEARQGFVDSVNLVLGKLSLPPIEAKDKVQLVGGAHFAESEGYDAGEAMPIPAGANAPTQPAAGRPLPRGVRRDAERRFGHDFGHVRLHDGAEGTRTAGRFAARALTSGSHVFLGAGVRPDGGAGCHVLYHELAHVLQQTGPRPLGAVVSDRPTIGMPARGLNFDAGREAEADRIAAAASRRRGDLAAPLPVSDGGVGLQPAPLYGATFARILRAFEEAQQTEDWLEDVTARVGRYRSPRGLKDACAYWNKVREALQNQSKSGSGFPSPLNTARYRGGEVSELVGDYVTKGRGKESIDDAIPVLAQDSARKTVIKAAKKPGRPQYALDVKLYLQLLAGFVYARTGLSLDIGINKMGKVWFHILSLDLGRIIHTDVPIWNEVIVATNGRISAMQKLGRAGSNWRALDDNDRVKIRSDLRDHPQEMKVVLDAWDFRLSDDYIAGYFRWLLGVGEKAVPPWLKYTTPVPTGQDKDQQRLRVGTHSELNAINKGNKYRRSHHVPSYVLVEYFRNRATTKFFDKPAERPPGFFPANATEPDEFSASGSPSGIDIDLATPWESNSSRGGGMPAVLLSTKFHESGNLHLPNTPAHSVVVQREFRNAFTAAAGISNYQSAVIWAQTNIPDGPRAVHAGMKAAYAHVYHFMFTELVSRLPGMEVDYYRATAESQANAVDPKTKQLLPDYDPGAPPTRLDVVTDELAKQQSRLQGFKK